MVEPFCELSRALLLTNTASGANRRDGVEAVREAASESGLRHHCADGVRDLEAGLRDAARGQAPRLIIVNAGDGTVCRLLDMVRAGGLFEDEPAFALLRGGTTNMIHNDVGVPGRPGAALTRLLAGLDGGRWALRERHVLRVSAPQVEVVHHGFFLGTHAVVEVIRRTRGRLHERLSTGRVSEAVSIIAMLWRLACGRVDRDPVLRPVTLELSRERGEWRRVSHILLLAISVRRAILGLRPLRRNQHAGLAVLNHSEYRLLPWLRRIVGGRMEELGSVSLRGEFDWILDGEIYRHGAADGVLTVEVDRPARFLIPEPQT